MHGGSLPYVLTHCVMHGGALPYVLTHLRALHIGAMPAMWLSLARPSYLRRLFRRLAPRIGSGAVIRLTSLGCGSLWLGPHILRRLFRRLAPRTGSGAVIRLTSLGCGALRLACQVRGCGKRTFQRAGRAAHHWQPVLDAL